MDYKRVNIFLWINYNIYINQIDVYLTLVVKWVICLGVLTVRPRESLTGARTLILIRVFRVRIQGNFELILHQLIIVHGTLRIEMFRSSARAQFIHSQWQRDPSRKLFVHVFPALHLPQSRTTDVVSPEASRPVVFRRALTDIPGLLLLVRCVQRQEKTFIRLPEQWPPLLDQPDSRCASRYTPWWIRRERGCAVYYFARAKTYREHAIVTHVIIVVLTLTRSDNLDIPHYRITILFASLYTKQSTAYNNNCSVEKNCAFNENLTSIESDNFLSFDFTKIHVSDTKNRKGGSTNEFLLTWFCETNFFFNIYCVFYANRNKFSWQRRTEREICTWQEMFC